MLIRFRDHNSSQLICTRHVDQIPPVGHMYILATDPGDDRHMSVYRVKNTFQTLPLNPPNDTLASAVGESPDVFGVDVYLEILLEKSETNSDIVKPRAPAEVLADALIKKGEENDTSNSGRVSREGRGVTSVKGWEGIRKAFRGKH